jgi:phosphonate transport system substrate-binding protein
MKLKDIQSKSSLRILSLIFFLSSITLGTALAATKQASLKLAVLSLAPPAKIFKQWTPFADYLAAQIGRDVEIIVPRGFKKIKEAVANDEVDMFYVNSLIYYRLKQEGKAVPIAQMHATNGSIYNQGILVARTDSKIKSLKDLKGQKLAFISPMASGGYLAQRAKFYAAGVKTKTETKEIFTKNLTTSLHKVILGDVKAAAMCGLSFKLMSQRIDTGELEKIGMSETFAESAFGAHPKLSAKLRDQISTTIINMDKNKSGRKILAKMKDLKVKKFVKYDPKVEDITRELLKKAEF